MSVLENIAAVREIIAAACAEAGRDPKEIILVGASKMNDAAACREAIAAGIDALGENRVQEMTAKLAETDHQIGFHHSTPYPIMIFSVTLRICRWRGVAFLVSAMATDRLPKRPANIISITVTLEITGSEDVIPKLKPAVPMAETDSNSAAVSGTPCTHNTMHPARPAARNIPAEDAAL